MRILSTLVLLAAAATGLPAMAQAQSRSVVVELFTSQGCSSCPPADELLAELGGREGVVALSYHVDYWDYLGWEDTFADPAYTKRQRAYESAANRKWIGRKLRGIFTPEIVVQGSDSLVGSHRESIEARIAAHLSAPAAATVALEQGAEGLVVRLAPAGTGEPPAGTVFAASYLPRAAVMIERGENAGREIVYSHVVIDLARVARWDGTGTGEFTIPGAKPPVAVFLQQGESGPILAAAKLE